jgi:DNA repair protein RadC
LKPSKADIQLTKKVKQAAKLMDIEELDHMILSSNEYFSFTDDGVMF